MVGVSLSPMGLISGIMASEGWGGMWLVWSPLIGSGFLPFVFAPLWRRLRFISENEFILSRYAQPWAQRLLQFRAWYVGGVVVVLILSMLARTVLAWLIALGLQSWQAWTVTAFVMAIGTLRWSWREKARTDLLHFILVLAMLIPALLLTPVEPDVGTFLQSPHTGWGTVWALVLMQWWSAVILDGGGIEAQVLMGTPRRKDVWIASALQQILVAGFLVSVALLVHRYLAAGGLPAGDATILFALRSALPSYSYPIGTLAVVGIFLSTSESFVNWGAGLILSSGAWGNWTESIRRLPGVRLSLVAASMVLALLSDSVQSLLLMTLGLTAGVAPVFALRWFWWRINAQVQLTAMVTGVLMLPLGSWLWGEDWDLGCQLMWSTPAVAVVCAAVMWLTNGQQDREAYQPLGQILSEEHPNIGHSLIQALAFGLLVFGAVLAVLA